VTYRGRVKNGVIVLDPPAALPEGCQVEVAPVLDESRPPAQSTRTLAERYAAIIGIVQDLPVDLSEQHDHYIHGAPRRGEE
jgi:hypothetical protein